MGFHETVDPQETQPAAEEVAALAQRLLGVIVGQQTGNARKIVSALDVTSDRIERLTNEINETNADRLRLMTELNDANARRATVEDDYQKLLARYVDLIRKVGDTDGHGVSISERIEAAILSSGIGLSIGKAVDLTPSHARDFMGTMASRPRKTQ